jgi:hypothetical protein
MEFAGSAGQRFYSPEQPGGAGHVIALPATAHFRAQLRTYSEFYPLLELSLNGVPGPQLRALSTSVTSVTNQVL